MAMWSRLTATRPAPHQVDPIEIVSSRVEVEGVSPPAINAISMRRAALHNAHLANRIVDKSKTLAVESRGVRRVR